GAALGAAFQVALPPLLKASLPIGVEFRLALLPFVRGMGMGLLTTVLFALWPLLEVRNVRPNLILRWGVADEALGSPGRMAWAISGLLALALAGLALWQAGSWRAAGLFIGALVAALALLSATAWLVVRLARRVPRWHPLAWRQGLANLYRPGSQTQTVLVSVGVAVMVILAIHLVERNILWEIGENVPTDAPTFFFIDIQPDQRDAFERLLVERGHTDARLTPLVRSRLWALNGQQVRRESYEDREHGWYFTREYVLTFLNELPKGNTITKGQWWDGGGSSGLPRVSVEEEAA